MRTSTAQAAGIGQGRWHDPIHTQVRDEDNAEHMSRRIAEVGVSCVFCLHIASILQKQIGGSVTRQRGSVIERHANSIHLRRHISKSFEL